MGSETRKKILKAIALLYELSNEEGVIEDVLLLEKQGKILNMDSQKPCTCTSIRKLGGNYVVP